MNSTELKPNDLELLRERGISVHEIERQLALFARPPHPVKLVRPCTLGDGIRRIDAAEHRDCLAAFEAAREAGRCLNFGPASGAASTPARCARYVSSRARMVRGQPPCSRVF